MIAAGVLQPHQKSSLLGPSRPAPSYRRLLSFCSSHLADEGLWWLALSPPTLSGCSAGDQKRTDGGNRRRIGIRKANQIKGLGQERCTAYVD